MARPICRLSSHSILRIGRVGATMRDVRCASVEQRSECYRKSSLHCASAAKDSGNASRLVRGSNLGAVGTDEATGASRTATRDLSPESFKR